MISNRGVKVWPNGNPATYKVNHWRCRYLAEPGAPVDNGSICKLMSELHKVGVDVIKTENLYNYDGEPGYSMGQGQ